MPPAEDKLSTVIIGCGDIAGGYDAVHDGATALSHAGAYRTDGRFHMAACVEPDTEKRNAFMKRWRIESGYDDLASCLENETSLDVASVCSPTRTHKDILAELLDSPVRLVFCEKPMTGDAASSAQIRDAYAVAGKKLCVNYLRRWDPEMTILRDEIADGEWGPIRSVTAFYAKGLIHTGGHMLDLLQFLLGPLAARHRLRETYDFSDDDPTVDAMLHAPDDVPVYLIGSDSNDYARFEAEIACALGVIRIEDSGFQVRRRRTDEHRLFPGRVHLACGTVTETGLDKALVQAAANIHAAIIEDAELMSDADSALVTERLCRDIFSLPLPGDSQ